MALATCRAIGVAPSTMQVLMWPRICQQSLVRLGARGKRSARLLEESMSALRMPPTSVWDRQDIFVIERLSSAANTSAYLWTGTRMKMRPPVDLHLAVVEPISPLAQTQGRQKQSGCVVAHAPLQFNASACIAQNAWTARERMSIRTPKRRR
jgi:hypothetical protein